MKDDITQSDGFANGMLVGSAVVMYPVVRGVAGAVGGAIDEIQRRAIIRNAYDLCQGAADVRDLVRPRMESIDQALAGMIGIEGARRAVQMSLVYLEDRIRWFTPDNIRNFVEANKVIDLVLLNEMAGFLVEPIREAVEAVRKELSEVKAAVLRKELLSLEIALVKFASDKFKADISREHEPNYLHRKAYGKFFKWVAILGVAAAGFITMLILTL